jgi:hypothetical protein
MKRSTITKLARPLRRIVRNTFVVTLYPEGILEVRPKHGRAGSERRFDIRYAFAATGMLPQIAKEKPVGKTLWEVFGKES